MIYGENPHAERLDAITRAAYEFEMCRIGLAAAEPGNDALNWFLGYMDWLTELRRLVREELC